MKIKITILIIMNLLWSAGAWIYDWSALFEIPIYFLSFIIICPIYPLLLAVTWWQVLKEKVNHTLLAFTAITSTAYLIGALIYYPTWMVLNNFDWLSLGQMFWVVFYGVQGTFLLFKYKQNTTASYVAVVFLTLSFIIQFHTSTFAYLDFTGFSRNLLVLLYSLVLVLTAALIMAAKYQQRPARRAKILPQNSK